MTREEAKKLLPIIQAYAEGKTIQQRVQVGYEDEWVDDNLPLIIIPSDYRIKPEVKYRPFKTKEECWNEMLRHEPFGCLKDCSEYHLVSSVGDVYIWFSDRVYYTFEEALDNFKFADGTPFGMSDENDEQ